MKTSAFDISVYLQDLISLTLMVYLEPTMLEVILAIVVQGRKLISLVIKSSVVPIQSTGV